ncbi:hypothetical protein DFH07DRAFT_863651 [Mycena maculata]|uniref:Uncharacterized protein n=1 Tax=Mycena maculata TaxID=230809 RepID=A0AAD7H884_9AGAR|nr:hypothetical protein DFH07DRAFT_863651 [Mycena maculata]
MLRTATRLPRRRQNAPLVALSRSSSSTAHEHDHHHEKDDIVYPKEGFGAPIWRKTLVVAIGAALFYECFGAPLDNDQPWLLPTNAKEENWSNVASTRAAKEAALIEERQLVRSAKRQPIYRARNPEDFHHISPYGNPVGMSVGWSVKSVSRNNVILEAKEAQGKQN